MELVKNKPKITRFLNVLLVDRSGSMQAIAQATVSGFNETINSIKNEAKKNTEITQLISVYTFDSDYKKCNDLRFETLLEAVDAAAASEIKEGSYLPDGGTPLYDAIAEAISRAEKIVNENTGVIFTILTDGDENSSKKYKYYDVLQMINLKRECGWMFTYMGANQDAEKVANSIGIRSFLNYDATEKGTSTAFKMSNHSRSSFYSNTVSGDSLESREASYFNVKN